MKQDTTIAARLLEVEERLTAACTRAGRPRAAVTLVAVSKTFPAEAISEGVAAGITDLGENRAQELQHKHAVLGDLARWHFVGHLQTNKVRLVVGAASLVHSVDRYGLAEAIARRAGLLGITQEVLLEVNVSGEPTKHGAEPASVLALAREVTALPNLELKGLMTMAPLAATPEESRPYFADLRELGAALTGEWPAADQLSMGMTRDFEVAVEEGATLVRVGEAIFGPRS